MLHPVIHLQLFINAYEKPPLEALSYLTGECNYGGRVTDDQDRRLICSLLQIFYNEKVINDDTYTFSDSGLYYAPPKGDYQSYVDYIRSLPLIPHPEVTSHLTNWQLFLLLLFKFFNLKLFTLFLNKSTCVHMPFFFTAV